MWRPGLDHGIERDYKKKDFIEKVVKSKESLQFS